MNLTRVESRNIHTWVYVTPKLIKPRRIRANPFIKTDHNVSAPALRQIEYSHQ